MLLSLTRITVDEVLSHLVAQTNAPSSMGAQLEQLSTRSEARKHGPGWTTHSNATETKIHDAEGSALRNATAYRVLQEITRVKDTSISVDALRAMAETHRRGLGECTIIALRAYHAALAAPSDDDLQRAERRAARAPEDKRDEVRQRTIAELRAPRGVAAVAVAFGLPSSDITSGAELYADARLLLGTFVDEFVKARGALVPACTLDEGDYPTSWTDDLSEAVRIVCATFGKTPSEEAEAEWVKLSKLKSGIPASTLRRWCESGTIAAAKKINGDWYVDMREMRRLLGEIKARQD